MKLTMTSTGFATIVKERHKGKIKDDSGPLDLTRRIDDLEKQNEKLNKKNKELKEHNKMLYEHP